MPYFHPLHPYPDILLTETRARVAMRDRRFCLFVASCVTVALLGLASFGASVVAETKRAKKEDLKLDAKLCYLPGSRAFTYGIAAVLCLSAAQIIGNLIVCKTTCSRNGRGNKKSITATILLVLSWISYGLAVLLLTAATSMCREQAYGEGWLDGECYLVKDGVYVGSGVLVLVTIVLTLSSAITTIRGTQSRQSQKI